VIDFFTDERERNASTNAALTDNGRGDDVMLRKASLVAVALCLFAGLAHAQNSHPGTVQELVGFCDSPAGSARRTACQAYIGGVLDGLLSLAASAQLWPPPARSSMRKLGICGDGVITWGAAAHAFKNWANAHPEKWGWTWYAGVDTALHTTWPCQSGKQP
jgi:Rap1a immunity proteins